MQGKSWIEAWWETMSLWEAAKFWIPTGISIAALSFVLKDRRPRLSVKSRKGEWFALNPSDRGVIFEGIIEIYNFSSRANAIQNYEFYRAEQDGAWTKLVSEHFTKTDSDGSNPVVFNMTPLVLAPNSGVEAKVQAMTGLSRRPYEMIVRIEIEDLFGKKYTVDVKAVP